METVLSEELATISAYSVSKKGIYSTPDLIEKSEEVFPPSLRVRLNESSLQEVKEAGKCLAFDIPTASGFHMLRATEEVMHNYYLIVCSPKKKSKLENWGAYIAALYKILEDETNPDDELKNHVKKVSGLLQQIKDQDRNLIMHPEVVLTSDDAFVLFEITKGAILTMAELLPTPNVKVGIPVKTLKT